MWTEAFSLTLKNNALSKIPILYFVYQFLKWTSFRTIWWHLLFVGSIAWMNTTTQLMISCVLHSLQFAANIFYLTWNSSKNFSLSSGPPRLAERWLPGRRLIRRPLLEPVIARWRNNVCSMQLVWLWKVR